jgi:hypothetical protein
LPRPARVDLKADWRLGQWTHCREYRAIAATLGALAALKLWHMYG